MKKFLLSVALALGPVWAPAVHAATNPLSLDLFGTTVSVPFQKVRGGFYYNFKDHATYQGVQTMIAGWGAKDSNGDRKVELSLAGVANIGKHKAMPALALDGKLSPKVFDTSNNTLFWGVWGWVQKDAKGASKPVGGFEANFLFW